MSITSLCVFFGAISVIHRRLILMGEAFSQDSRVLRQSCTPGLTKFGEGSRLDYSSGGWGLEIYLEVDCIDEVSFCWCFELLGETSSQSKVSCEVSLVTGFGEDQFELTGYEPLILTRIESATEDLFLHAEKILSISLEEAFQLKNQIDD